MTRGTDRDATPWNDPEWFESYVALRDAPLGALIFWLDSLLDVAVDEKSTRAEVRAAQKAYDFALVAHGAYLELRGTMRAEVREPADDDGEDDTTLDAPASETLEAIPGPTLGEYAARAREVLPKSAPSKGLYAMKCLEQGMPLEAMCREHYYYLREQAKPKPAPKKRGRPPGKKKAK